MVGQQCLKDGSAIFPPGLSHVCGSHSIVISVGMLIRTDTAHADMEASCHTQTSHPALTVAALSFCHHLYKHVSHPPQVRPEPSHVPSVSSSFSLSSSVELGFSALMPSRSYMSLRLLHSQLTHVLKDCSEILIVSLG